MNSSEIIARYLMHSARLAVLGSTIRKDNRSDESWTKEESDEWDAICDDIDPWWYALSEEDKKKIDCVQEVMSKLTCGESL